jgi:Rrf2 family protein
MLQLTKRTEYGLIAMVHLAQRGGEFVSVREICEHYPIPRRLVAEVLKELGRAELVESHRGAAGGYALSRAPEHIALSEVVAALEGEPGLTSCQGAELRALGQGGQGHAVECGVQPTCPIRSPIHRIREHLWDLMQRTTLRSLTGSAPLALESMHR